MGAERIEGSYSFIDHTADVGIEVRTKDFPSLLEEAAKAMFDVITDISKVKPHVKAQITITRGEDDQTLRDWLEELLHRFYTEDMVFSRFRLSSPDRSTLVCGAWGEVFDPHRHTLHTEIKGITYHQYEVSHQSNQGWYARIIFDV